MKTFISIFACIFLWAYAALSFAQNIAITIDNPNTEPAPLLDAEMRDKKILSALNENHLKVVLFVQGSQVDNAKGRALLARWNEAGQVMGNHTYSHANINSVSVEQYEFDVLKDEVLLQSYANFQKIFRFPFLKEGDTRIKRDEFRRFLREHAYKTGSVTIDASDWYISDRLEKRLAQHPYADVAPYRDYYLQHIWNRAQYYDGLAMEVLGRSPDHILLLHHNLLNALFLDDVIKMFQRKGWKMMDADKAFQDPIFKMSPNTLPAGESLIWALAKETGRYDDKLRYPAEDGSYEKEAMDKLGL